MCRAVDERDNVYALLSLASDAASTGILLDYRIRPLSHVYTTVARGMLQGKPFDWMKKSYLAWREHGRRFVQLLDAREAGEEAVAEFMANTLHDTGSQPTFLDGGIVVGDFDQPLPCQNRRLAWTSCGALALVPRFTAPADILFIAEVAPAPSALRHVEHDRYLMLGGSYIQGYMFGEAWTDERLKDMHEVVLS
ncbi:hypothetical protein PV08_02340 [Exophiala spinifera]|uniref:Heterokaryon incompatibility domain-containing protein n=1 Tax=Exophiala spinifera TaxID=91928 RepID=A0A0D2BGF6_9EURO|nr:uncharacterized protein PV08_02340 [Exophiala spinifera]KIW18053.1 hypothetical protein PV08_02340 [Exophiala spinifera]